MGQRKHAKPDAAQLRRMADTTEDAERGRKLRILAEQYEEAERSRGHRRSPAPV